MSRISSLFRQKNKEVLSIYFTAGFPELNDTIAVLKNLQEAGADMVEIGMPFSDPLADGPVIQASSQVALENGMNLKVLFRQLEHFREKITMPVILMGYLNPVIQFGIENFLRKCREVGVDGLILPDLPIAEFQDHYQSLFLEYGIDFVMLVTPETSADRLKKIDDLGSGFIYAVSSSSTTGKDKDIESKETYFERLQKSDLKNPVMVGFGIKDRNSFLAACQHTNGAIIGTAFIRALQEEGGLKDRIERFIEGIKE